MKRPPAGSSAASPAAPILVLGEAVLDVVRPSNGVVSFHPGGSPANVARGLARLDHPVLLATQIGRDDYGERLRAAIRDAGVVLTDGCTSDAPTSTALVSVDRDGTASYKVSLHWDPAPAVTRSIAAGRIAHLHTGSVAATLEPGAQLVHQMVMQAKETTTISYDLNLRPGVMGMPDNVRQPVEDLIAASHIVKASDEDIAWLYSRSDLRNVATAWLQLGPAIVVVTLGGRGSITVWKNGLFHLPAISVDVVDTVGAGDAYMSGLLSGLHSSGLIGRTDGVDVGAHPRSALYKATSEAVLGPTLLAALTLANKAAALSCSRQGASPPTRSELDSFAADV